MSINGIGSTNWIFQYDNSTQKTAGASTFTQSVSEVKTEQVDAYQKQLAQKYGVRVRVESVGKDQATLERVGRGMSGNDVVIAPNILAEMATDSAKAAYYEEKIADYFKDIPSLTAQFAAQGLTYEPGGVVIHEDGTVTYISGCSDSPERVAEVNRINREKQEKELEQIRANLEASADSREALREQVSAMVNEWRAGSSVRHLMLWSEALQSARKATNTEQKGVWDILFEKRAEWHDEAMELSRKARAAARSNTAATQAYEVASTTSAEAAASGSNTP